MKEHEKLSTLIFDEKAITPHFDCNQKSDRISEFVNYEGKQINSCSRFGFHDQRNYNKL